MGVNDWTENNRTEPQGSWGQGSVNNSVGWAQGALNNLVSWGIGHAMTWGHAITNLVGGESVPTIYARQFPGLISNKIEWVGITSLIGKTVKLTGNFPDSGVTNAFVHRVSTSERFAIGHAGAEPGNIGAVVDDNILAHIVGDKFATFGITSGSFQTITVNVIDYSTPPTVEINGVFAASTFSLFTSTANNTMALGQRSDSTNFFTGEIFELEVDGVKYNEANNWNGGTITGTTLVKSIDGGETWTPA